MHPQLGRRRGPGDRHRFGRTPSPGGAMHDVLIDGLLPDTPYFYAVTAGGETTEVARFRTPPPSDAERTSRLSP